MTSLELIVSFCVCSALAHAQRVAQLTNFQQLQASDGKLSAPAP
jgi:hypothetical protein